ncbi:MAG TPA: histidine phosphatase family protein [Steroidobacteraceae bacterium]|nr:histidine phosphatase family protein [Steroidobacteraceae bacterium]
MGAHRRLTLLRHGQAGSADAYAEDFERPLTRHGIREAEEMAKRLVFRDWRPDLIVASPAERAWVTAEILARGCELDSKALRAARELYLASPEAIWRIAGQCEPTLRHVLICGHNPGLSGLASRFGPKPKPLRLATAGLASAVWKDGDWRLLEPQDAVHCEIIDPDDAAELSDEIP